MRRAEMADLTAFVVVAEELSFTRAAAKLGLSQSALSQIMRRLETRLDLRLLARTTRSVAPTEAGERLLRILHPALGALDTSIAALSELREKPAGTIRITSVEHATKTYIWPALKKLLQKYPDIQVEIIDDYALADLVRDKFDAGVRLGDQVDKDMISVRIAPDMPMAVVASPSYFTRQTKPKVPQELVRHRCINMRLPTSGGFYVWGFEKKGRALKVHTEGAIVFNTLDNILDAALEGFGITYMPKAMAQKHLDSGRLIAVLDDWCPRLPGYHLYYPSRRQQSTAFALLVSSPLKSPPFLKSRLQGLQESISSTQLPIA